MNKHPNVAVLYHENCADGFTSAAIVHKKFQNKLEEVVFFPCNYNNDPPELSDMEAIIVLDFSFDEEQTEKYISQCNYFIMLDHHASAKLTLTALSGKYKDSPNVTIEFDMERSGAGMTWDYFFTGEPRPMFVNLIEDRDLFLFKYPDTKFFQSTVFSYSYTFENWEKLMDTPISVLTKEGAVIHRKHEKDIDEIIKHCKRELLIYGKIVPAFNVMYMLGSDLCAKVVESDFSIPFCAYYYDIGDSRNFGLRSCASNPDAMDVSIIAKRMGGGGHKNASGFSLPIKYANRFEVK